MTEPRLPLGGREPILYDAMRRNEEVLAFVLAEHGMRGANPNPDLDQLVGDLNHLIQPIIGMLRMQGGSAYMIERLSLAITLVDRAGRAAQAATHD